MCEKHVLFLLRKNYIALFERIKLYLLNRLITVDILNIQAYRSDKYERRYLAMSFFNDAQIKGMMDGLYVCHECGCLMEFEDELEDTLVCPSCGHSVDLDEYGCEGDECYENLYPTREEVIGEE